jgi:hypothetical protein
LGDEIATAKAQKRASPFGLQVRVHDAAHLEWEVTAPLPPPGTSKRYEVDLTVEVPESVWSSHDPWRRFWARSRLQAPARRADDTSRDLSTWVLATVRDGKGALSDVRKQWRSAARGELGDEALKALRARTAERLSVAESRFSATPPFEPGSAPLYLAGRWWTELSEALVSLDRLSTTQPRLKSLRGLVTDRIEAAIERVRSIAPFNLVDERERERFLRRLGDLKRAFHRRLYLDAVVIDADSRYTHLVAAFVAIVASSWAFLWQVALINHLAGAAITGTALLTVGTLVGVVYAVKDRIKEIGRRWLHGWIRTSYAGRVVRLYLRPDTDPRRPQLLRSRETIRVSTQVRPDGSRFNVLDVLLRLDLQGRDAPRALGIERVKHILRYDFSDILVGLERAPHMLAVPSYPGEMKILAVDKTYELPCECRVRVDGTDARVWRGTLHMSDRGLETLERRSESPASPQ